MSTQLSSAAVDLIAEAVANLKPLKGVRHTAATQTLQDCYTLDQITQLKFPASLALLSHVDFTSMPLLYSLDTHHAGLFTLSDILNFAERCYNLQLQYKQQLQHQGNAAQIYYNPIHAHTALHFYQALTSTHAHADTQHANVHSDADETANGIDYVTEWLVTSLLQCGNSNSTKNDSTGRYLSYDHLLPLYELIRCYLPSSTHADSAHQTAVSTIDFQSFFDLLQHVGECDGTLDVENSALDLYVPYTVVEQLVKQILTAVVDSMRQIGIGGGEGE